MVYTCRSVSIAESLLWCIPVDQYLWLNLCYGSDQRILPVDASFLLSLDSPHDPVTLYSLSSPLEELKLLLQKKLKTLFTILYLFILLIQECKGHRISSGSFWAMVY